MILPDVNVLLYAYRQLAPDHQRYRAWLEAVVNGEAAFGVTDPVLSGFLRIGTNPRLAIPPSTPEEALRFVERLRGAPACVPVAPGPRHWDIFADLCRKTGATGNLVPDIYFAALAIESGCEWVTTDRDYTRFPGLRWRHPLA